MLGAPLALAFAAGLVATVNPCGFAMLPAYLSYFMGLGGDDRHSRPEAMRRALTVGVVVSSGFLVVFGLAGVLITAGFRSLIDLIPWLALVVGGLIVTLGVALLTGLEVTVGFPKLGATRKDQGYRSVFLFGVSYAVASLSCTLPVFLTVVANQVTAGSFVSGVVTFLAYGMGMSMLLIGVTIALAFGKQTLVGRLRASAQYINRIAGGILVAAGAYIVWFWVTNISSGAGALGGAGAFRIVEDLSQRALAAIGNNPLWWGAGLAAVIGGAVAYAWLGPGRDPSPVRSDEPALETAS